MAGRSDPCGEVHVISDVALVSHERRPRVQTDAQVDAAVREGVGDRLGGSYSAWSGREGEEEGVSLGVHLDAVLGRARLADDASVLGERVCVGLRAEFVEERRRSLYVGKEEGDGAGREVVTHAA